MPRSVQGQILARVRANRPRAVFVPADFLDLGSRAAVDQTLSRLVRAGFLRRVARGIYDRPRHHPRLGALSPSLPLVAAAIARSTGSQLQVSGLLAANQLGVSTQVPARLAYLTDGPTRAIRVGSRMIEFRHASPRTLTGAGTAAGVVIQALRYLGRSGVTPEVVARVREALRHDDRSAVQRYVSRAPAWMRPPLLAIARRGRRARAG
ncbi:MAG: DUF6088 family protein [Planctomycetota bacterium]